MTEKVYSITDEWFNYDELKALIGDYDLKAGEIVYVGEPKQVVVSSLFSADDLIETLAERMYDEVGEAADDWPFVTTETKQELNAGLKELIEKHFRHSFCRVVNVQEYTLTEEDVSE